MCTQEDFERLRNYLCDMVLEEQLKLGFERETIRFYSPCASIGHILGKKECTCEAVMKELEVFGTHVADTLGEIKISRYSGERICFLIPVQGTVYVHEHWNRNSFLEELIDCFKNHGITLSDVQSIFEKFSKRVECMQMRNHEFDAVLFFADGIPDQYRYCVKFDAGHAFYHRFLKEDFEELFAEERSMDTSEDNNKRKICDSYSL